MKRNYYILLSLIILFLIILNYDNLTNFFTLKEGLTEEEKKKNKEHNDKLSKLNDKMNKIKKSLYNNKEENDSNEKISYITYLNKNNRKKKIKKWTEVFIEWIDLLYSPLLDKAKEDLNTPNKTYKEHEKDFKSGFEELFGLFMNFYSLNLMYDMDIRSIVVNKMNNVNNLSGGGGDEDDEDDEDDDYDYANMFSGVSDSVGLLR